MLDDTLILRNPQIGDVLEEVSYLDDFAAQKVLIHDVFQNGLGVRPVNTNFTDERRIVFAIVPEIHNNGDFSRTGFLHNFHI